MPEFMMFHLIYQEADQGDEWPRLKVARGATFEHFDFSKRAEEVQEAIEDWMGQAGTGESLRLSEEEILFCTLEVDEFHKELKLRQVHTECVAEPIITTKPEPKEKKGKKKKHKEAKINKKSFMRP